LPSENVELVRSIQLGDGFDLVPLIRDDQACGWWGDAFGRSFDPRFQFTMRRPGRAPATYSGLDGLRDGLRDWLEHWTSYYEEIELVVDSGERVVLVHRCHGRLREDGPRVTHQSVTVWTVRDRRIASLELSTPPA
jgi:ketosteroid isomerase-like protein